jgi:hypothetical protein
MAAKPKFTDKEQELVNRFRRAKVAQGNRGLVPSKGQIKYSGRATVSTFEQSLRGVPGTSRNKYTSMVQEIAAPHTGTRTRKEGIGVLRSARNANTTQGSYIRTEVRENGQLVSDAQGRKEFGR